jgi:Cytochrome c7 and related cytochrome c
MADFKDSAHLIRLAGVFLLGVVLFFVLRSVMVPRSFGRYGPFRGDALAEISARPVAFAGHETCENCHPDEVALKANGAHKTVNCESCHGPLAKHADDPGTVQPVLPDVAKLCIRCHSENISKPSGFPQVDAKEHSGGQACDTCHKPHSPGLDAGGKK